LNKKDSENPDYNSDRQIKKKDSIEEYRLVPMDAYEYEDEQIIDIIGILKDLWNHRRFIFIVTTVCLLIGVFFYFGSERVYYSEAKLLPESSNESSQLGQIFQQAENIFGLQRRGEEEDIGVAMYPFIVESMPFQIELMQEEIYFSDLNERVTIFEYFTEHYKPSMVSRFYDFLWNITLGLPNSVMSIINSIGNGGDDAIETIDFSLFSDFNQPTSLPSNIRSVANTVTGYITIQREPQSGFINVGVSLPDRVASTEMVIVVKNLLQNYVIDYRTEKALNNLLFIEEQFEEAKRNFEMLQDSLAKFEDQNINPARQSLVIQQERLQFEVEMAFALYSNIGRRYQEAKITVQEETPVFRVHEPATIPTRPSDPKIEVILIGSLFVGIFGGIMLLYIIRGVAYFREEFEKKEITSKHESV
jgi:capsular polysaccharide biosynthesis protein